MKKPLHLFIFICLAVFFFSALNVSAQTSRDSAAPGDGSGSTGPETVRGICTDARGNAYTIGVFGNTSDFELNSSTTSTTAAAAKHGYFWRPAQSYS